MPYHIEDDTLVCDLNKLSKDEVERLFINIGMLKVSYETTDSERHVSITPVIFDTDNGGVKIVPLVTN